MGDSARLPYSLALLLLVHRGHSGWTEQESGADAQLSTHTGTSWAITAGGTG